MKKVLLGLIALIVVLVAGVAIALATIDANKYRGQIADVLSKQTGRTVTLKGPIGFGLSLHGVVITVQDAAISNPSWASRPNMAGIGHFELGVALLPLLDKQVSITEVKIENADILLETAANGKHNWDMAAQQQGTPAKAPEKPSGQSVAIQVNNVSIKDSQIGLRDKDGKTSLFKASDMTFGQEHGGIALHFAGEYNDTPIKLDLKSGASDFTSTALEALDVDLTYAAYHIKAKGTASLGGKKANITDYQVAAGASTVHGQLAADWSGAKPEVKGTLQSDKLNPADFKPAAATAAEGGSSKGVAPAASNSEFVFSDAPLPLDGLKSANAAFDVNISELVMGNGKLTNLSSKTTLNGGKLVAPVKFTLGNSPMSGEATVNAAASPAQVTLIFSAPSAELADLLKFAGAPAFLTGKANADINITSAGNTLHQMAEHANGKIDIVGGSGSISKSEAGSLSAGLMEILGGSNALNCMVARFSVAGGVMKDNGILLDTSARATRW